MVQHQTSSVIKPVASCSGSLQCLHRRPSSPPQAFSYFSPAAGPVLHSWPSASKAKSLIHLLYPKSKAGHCTLTWVYTSLQSFSTSTEEQRCGKSIHGPARGYLGPRELNWTDASLLGQSYCQQWALSPGTGCCSISCAGLSRICHCAPCCSTTRHVVALKHLSCVRSLVLSWREVWAGRAVLGKGQIIAVENVVKNSSFLVLLSCWELTAKSKPRWRIPCLPHSQVSLLSGKALMGCTSLSWSFRLV